MEEKEEKLSTETEMTEEPAEEEQTVETENTPAEEQPQLRDGRRPKKAKKPKKRKLISFRMLAFEALPEIINYMFVAALILGIASMAGSWAVSKLLEMGGTFAITTANVKDFVTSCRIIPILIVALLLLILNLILGVFGSIYQCDDILKGGKVSFGDIFLEAFDDLKRFLNPSGLATIAYMVLGVPIVGFGFTIDLVDHLQIPKFIMSVVESKWYFRAGYYLLFGFLLWKGIMHFFTLHGVLLDNLPPREAKKQSSQVVKKNWKELLITFLLVFAAATVIQYVVDVLIFPSLTASIREFGLIVPEGYALLPFKDGGIQLTNFDLRVLGNRTLAFFYVIFERLIMAGADLMISGYVILKVTQLYRRYVGHPEKTYPERPWIKKYAFRLLTVALGAAAVLGISFVLALNFDIYAADPVDPYLVAHRAGGYLASENSNEGLEKAIEAGTYGSEIDVQRTLDGKYVINHDRTFQRLAGESRASQEMTFDEVMALRIQDTTGSGREIPVATMEQMLDTIKGRHKLFIELKGATADRQMADDLVKMIREKDCLEDVVLISLDYDVMKYTKETYPEFETGVLLFAGFGELENLNCDYVMLSQESATPRRIRKIREQGKNAVVWTVNDTESLYTFLDGQADYILTDDVEQALKVQEMLKMRTEIERIMDYAAEVDPRIF